MQVSKELTGDREVVIKRTVNAPRELVFRAWTDPSEVDQWWGPDGFVNKTKSMDVKVGGKWIYDMESKERGTFPNMIQYLEVTPPERLVYDHGEPDAPPAFRVVVTFVARGEKTELTMHSTFPTAAARDKVVNEFGAIEGGKQTLARLDAFLAKT